MTGCKYCNPHGEHLKHIQDCAVLYSKAERHIGGSYIYVEMCTGGDKSPSIMCNSGGGNLANRCTFQIKYCPMCGEKLGGDT